MRYLIIIITVLVSSSIFAQSPEKMSYQAVIRDANSLLVSNQTVGLRISILQGNINGNSVYTETHSPLTNANGLINIEIGLGSVVSGTFSSINWENGPFFIKSETDITGGTNYTISGTSQLISVPYALYSNNSNHANYADSVAFDPAYLYMRKKATIQNVNSGVNTSITDYDNITSNNFTLNNSTGEITFNESGIYVISASTSFDAGNNPGRKIIWFDCNSTYNPGRFASNECDGVANRISISSVGKFDAGDKITFKVFQTTGLILDCPSNTLPDDETQVNIEKIR